MSFEKKKFRERERERSVKRITTGRRRSGTPVSGYWIRTSKEGNSVEEVKRYLQEKETGVGGISNETLENIVKTWKRKQYPRVGSSECPLTICVGLAQPLLFSSHHLPPPLSLSLSSSFYRLFSISHPIVSST